MTVIGRDTRSLGERAGTGVPAWSAFPSEPASVPIARSFVRDALAEADVDHAVATTAVLLASEVVTNAVLHTDTDFDVRVEVAPAAVRVEVMDDGDGQPHVERAGPDAEHGRGLAIVSRLATRWGVTPHEQGKSVWFEVRCPAAPSRRERQLLLDAMSAQARRFTRRTRG